MKKRIRGMTSASRGEKERKKGGDGGWLLNASGRMVQAREEHRIGVMERSSEERRTKKAVGRVSRVWQLFRAKDERRRDI